MLNDFEVTISKEENDRVDSIRYSFQKLMRSAVSLFSGLTMYIKLSHITWKKKKKALNRVWI